MTTVSDNALILAAHDLALGVGCSLYDGLYLALAEMTVSPLVFADARLRRTIADHFPLAFWLPDYRPAQR
jgi:predicted nucleic acid-binding protein